MSSVATASTVRASFLRAVIAVLLLAGVPLGALLANEQTAKPASVTIICCDFLEDVAVLTDADSTAMLAALVSVAAKSRFLLLPVVPQRMLRTGATSPQAVFLAKLRQLFTESTTGEVKLMHPVGFNGYDVRYDITDGMRGAIWVLELRFSAVVKQIYGPYMPSAGAYFRLVRMSDQHVATSGIVSTVNTSRGEPGFFTRPYAVPLIPTLGGHALGKEMILLPAPPESLIQSFDPRSPADVERAHNALNDMAEKVASSVFQHVKKFVQMGNSVSSTEPTVR